MSTPATAATLEQRSITYNDDVTRKFIWASVIWGSVGLLVGVIIALQLANPAFNFGIEFLTYSRLRPLHTNAVIFALVGNMMFAGVYYSTQRLLKARLPSDLLANVHFWAWQAIILSAALTLPFGITAGKEYAELEWPIDLAITLVWVVFAINIFWTMGRRNEKNMYVALWFYIATIITVAVLHIFNSLELPVSLTKSYSVYAGVQDALVQWWYGHNAVAFFLTTPILGIMYYFLPKAAERPVYSYRLSIVHFWSLVFVYIWAGPHHLLYTALPDWAQSLGMVFSLMLWAPSWGGMLNGLLTLRGAWHKVRVDPVLKFFAAAVTFYGMSTFEGPLLSIKSVSSLAHYTDWIIAHVHGGALGWNGLMAAGMFYWLIPRLYGTTLKSVKAADYHFWMATVGILLYMIAMWTAGVSQGLMLRAVNEDGALLYPDFVETVVAIRPLYWIRVIGGLLYLVGFLMMAWNLWATAKSGKKVDGEASVVGEMPQHTGPTATAWELLWSREMFFVVGSLGIAMLMGSMNMPLAVVALVVSVSMGMIAWILSAGGDKSRPRWHSMLEGKPLLFTILVVVSVLVGGLAELVPTIFVRAAVPSSGVDMQPYTPLELEGRDVYISEGCYTCHSQMVRPLPEEKLRYGDPSVAEESRYDHPFQWGSRRMGPDLARVGGKYGHQWHLLHMNDPRSINAQSNMPPFPWLAEKAVDFGTTQRKVEAMVTLGVPYTDAQVSGSREKAEAQAKAITAELEKAGSSVKWDSKMVALISYLQRLGKPTSDFDKPAAVTSLPVAPAAGTP